MAAVGGDSSGAGGGHLVCVTGGSGFIGSWLVHRLLHRGYTVHATVKNLQDEGETKHLLALDGADTRLRLFQMDLLDPASVQPAINGALGVFHLASPMILEADDTEAIFSQHNLPPMWFLSIVQFWYGVSKTMAEKAAWEFAAEQGLQLIVINPGMVIGPMLTPSLNASLHFLLQILQVLIKRAQNYVGERDLDDIFIGCVDVRDVAHSLITLYENPSAQGRHLCMESITRSIDFLDEVADMYPEFPVQRVQEDKQKWVIRAKDPAKKLIDLGVCFTPIDKTIKDTVDCFRSKALI
ncbi:hypothetical protein PR202_gb04360 [Eleusine coracana subsp. coracana]|uniref:NAD(P)-binding domain-containing protein n=1 Tax=Eleusine coracana subsp. coracana TaxID=191504 RepID=A0AAV5E4E4_ELECO|nr:hypothetical protein PR202_gb04360 [Eleusine coracana subsp. coracana]